MRTVAGFDPFQNGWEAFDTAGIEGMERIEAPLLVYEAEPEIAGELAEKYAAQGLRSIDLRFGVWPDASPVQIRTNEELVGVHLNVFGSTQVRYGLATEVEKAVISGLSDMIDEHIREVIDPQVGTAVMRFGKIPTMHHHVLARERPEDATSNWLERGLVDLDVRRAMRDRVELDLIPGRRAKITKQITEILHRYAS